MLFNHSYNYPIAYIVKLLIKYPCIFTINMRTSPDFYLQKDGTILAFNQSVEPYGQLILGYDYEKQCWVNLDDKGQKMVIDYLKSGKTIKIIKS